MAMLIHGFESVGAFRHAAFAGTIDGARSMASRHFYTCDGLADGARCEVELTCVDYVGNGSLMAHWVRNGHVDRWMDGTLSVKCYLYEGERCSEPLWLNPYVKEHADEAGVRRVIDFEWLLPAEDESVPRILAEVEARLRSHGYMDEEGQR